MSKLTDPFRFLLLVLFAALVAGGFESATSAAEPPAGSDSVVNDSDLGTDEEFSALLAQMRHDLTKAKSREKERIQASAAAVPMSFPRGYIPPDSQIDQTALPKLRKLLLPIRGISRDDLENNYGAPRDGGRRRHRGIDIFAPRGAEVVAVADGTISLIANQRKGGKVVWITADDGRSYYYAHLDRWAPGIAEGMSIMRGTVIGYVGNTGNARKSSPHLHFSVSDEDQSINPYELLSEASEPVLAGGFGSQ